MRSKKVEFLRTFRIVGARVVVVAFLLLALLPGTAKGFTLIELLGPAQFIPQVFDVAGYPCNTQAALAWDNYITDHLAVGDFTVGFSGGDPSGIFFSLTPAPQSTYLYTYGNGATGITATMRIRLEDLKKLPLWRGLVADTRHAQVSMLYGRWDVMRATGPIGGFPGDLRFDIGNVTRRVPPFTNPDGCKLGVDNPCVSVFNFSTLVHVVCVVPEYRN